MRGGPLAPASSSELVRAYAFAGAPPSPYAQAEDCGLFSLLLINLSNSSSAAAALPPFPGAAAFAAWSLTAADGAFGAAAALNGAPLPLTVDAAKVDPRSFLQRIVQAAVRAPVSAGISLPPTSTTFLCYHA